MLAMNSRHSGVDVSVTRDQVASMIEMGALSQQKEQLPAFPGLQHASNVKPRTWIERRADVTGEHRLVHGGRL